MRINFNSWVFRLFVAWVFLSAFYYVGNFIDGQIIVERSGGLTHKAFKYFAAIILSAMFYLYHKDVKLLIQYAAIVLVIFAMGLYWFYGYNVIFSIDILIVFLSFIGLTYATSNFDAAQIAALIRAIVVSACIVSIISYFEYYFMEPVLGYYWSRTGGFRSISTLLNPNNLGLFLGSALILLLFGNQFSTAIRIVICSIVIGALLMSGSRTALVSLSSALSLGFVYRGAGRFNAIKLLKFIILLSSVTLMLSLLVLTDFISLPERATDMYTAQLRIEKYFEYLTSVDVTYLFPDFNLERIDMVSESAYFHFINSLGLLYFVAVSISLLFFYRPAWLSNLFSNSPHRCFDIVIFYYFVAMLFENVFMSFPNNQTFFISLGVTIVNFKDCFLKLREPFHLDLPSGSRG